MCDVVCPDCGEELECVDYFGRGFVVVGDIYICLWCGDVEEGYPYFHTFHADAEGKVYRGYPC